MNENIIGAVEASPRELAKRIEIRHRCDCATATEGPGEDGTEHVLRIDGADFPWHISKAGPRVTREGDGLYTVAVEIYAEEVDAMGVPVFDCGTEEVP